MSKLSDAIRDATEIESLAPVPESQYELAARAAMVTHVDFGNGLVSVNDPAVSIHARTIKGRVVSVWFSSWIGGAAPAPPAPAAAVLPFPMPAPKPIITGLSGWRGTYADYTSHPEFRRIAALAKKEWGYACLLNVKHRGPVEMHHRTYAHVPFGEDWRDLIPLCAECHGRHHMRLTKPPIGLFDDDVIKRAA
jgi:hypothetical protein